MGNKIKNILRNIAHSIFLAPGLHGIVRALSKAGVLPQWMWVGTPMDRILTISHPGCHFLYQYKTKDSIGALLYWRGNNGFEPETMPVFLELAKEAKIFIDIGANTGFYSLMAASINPDCEIKAFEPVPESLAAFTENIQINHMTDKIQIEKCAISNFTGKTQLHVPKSDYCPNSASLHDNGFRGFPGQKIDIDVMTLDDYLKNKPLSGGLIKIDVEGFENNVLDGMKATIRKFSPIILLECLKDGPAVEITELLSEYGYRFIQLTNRRQRVQTSIKPDARERFKNWLCVPRGQTPECIKNMIPAKNFLMRLRKLSSRLASIRGMDRVLDPVRKLFAKNGGMALITDFDHNLNFYVRLNEHMGSQIFWYGAYSPGPLKALSRLMRADSVFVDIGANDGEFTCFAAKRCHHVIAIEPVTESFRRLSCNVCVNRFKNVEMICAAIGNRQEKLKIFTQESLFSDGTRHTGLPTLHPHGNRQTPIQNVEVFPLDELLDRKQRVDIIKIDVEGHELSVLKGANRLIDAYHPVLLIEITREPLEAAGTSMIELFQYVIRKGYKAELVDHQGLLFSIKETGLKHFQNVLFTKL